MSSIRKPAVLPDDDKRLAKSLTVAQAVGLGITIVVGSGLLLLPGLAYKAGGALSIYVWLFCALLVIPLLFIFSSLGRRYPTAGGIAGFMQHAFSRHWGAATEIMLLGTFGLGIPAIALTGSYYLNILLFAEIQSEYSALLGSFLMVLIAYLVNYFGAGISGNVQKYLAVVLVLILALLPVLSLAWADAYQGSGIASPANIEVSVLFPLIGLVFFAYTGWEMLSFTIEEYKDPQKDYPVSVALSFIIVLILYIALVYSIQTIVPRTHPLLTTAPLSALAEHVFGAISGKAIAFLSVIIIVANLIGAVWAASRLVFSSAREGLLPSPISTLSGGKIPRISLAVTCLLFVIILVLNFYDLLQTDDLLRLAGQNFFILYGMAVIAYCKISQTRMQKIFGGCSLLIVMVTMGTFGAELLYPLCLLCLGYIVSKSRQSTVVRNRGKGARVR